MELLLIEPNTVARRAWERALPRIANANVVAFAEAREALDSFSKYRYDGVICSVRQPRISAWQLVSLIRSGNLGYQHIPVFITAPDADHTVMSPLLDPFTELLDDSRFEKAAGDVACYYENMVKARVLVIGQKLPEAEAAAAALTPYCTTRVTTSGTYALELQNDFRPDVVLLDMELTTSHLDDTGSQFVLDQMLVENPQQVIVGYTEQANLSYRTELMLQGISDVIGKPLEPNFLAGRLLQTLYSKRMSVLIESASGLREKQDRDYARIRAVLVAGRHYLIDRKYQAVRKKLDEAIAMVSDYELSDDEQTELDNLQL